MADAIIEGVVTDMVQNTVYALPPTVVFVHSSAAVEVSLSSGTTGYTTLTNANTVGAPTSAPFVRCTTGAAQIIAKRY